MMIGNTWELVCRARCGKDLRKIIKIAVVRDSERLFTRARYYPLPVSDRDLQLERLAGGVFSVGRMAQSLACQMITMRTTVLAG